MTVTVFRIGYSFGTAIDDQAHGSTLFEGRWHSLRAGLAPRRVIYAASSRALAQLEKRVHANGVAPIHQTLFSLTVPDTATLRHASGLPADWREDIDRSQTYGNAWLDAALELALWVPSYVEQAEDNLLINPDHPDIRKVTLAVDRDPFVFDPRLT